MARILVIEDEHSILDNIVEVLESEDFEVIGVDNGRSGIEAAIDFLPDLILCDIMMPEFSGHDVLMAVRTESSIAAVPFVFLTALATRSAMRRGMELGADDYLTKPFSPRELVLRVQSVLRRADQGVGETGGRLLRAGPVTLDIGAHQATMHGEELSLTPTEFRLLQALMERRGRTQSRRQLLERAWDVEAEVADRIQTRTVDMHVRRLRGKLGPVGDWVETVRGFGYRLKVPEGEA